MYTVSLKRKQWQRCLIARLSMAWCILAASISLAAEPSFIAKLPAYKDAICVPVFIRGGAHLCIIDSGANHIAFHSTLRETLGNPIGNENPSAANGERFRAELFSAPVTTIGTIELKSELPVTCFDMTTIRESTGRNIEGIVGLPLFFTNVIQMDFDGQEVRILAQSTKPLANWGQPFKVSYTNSGLPIIDVVLGNQIITQCAVDTGSTGSVSLASDVFEKLVTNQQITHTQDESYVQANGIRSSRSGVLSTIKVGDFENRGLRVGEGGRGRSRLGLGYLRRFRVTFDLARDQIYLAKGTSLDTPDQQQIGIALLRRNGKTVIYDVLRESAAEKAELLTGDEIVSVAGQPITDQPIAEVAELIREKAGPNGKTLVGFRRGKAEQTTSIAVPK